MIHDPSVSVTLDATSEVKNGVVFTGKYAEFHGEGFKDTNVTIKPKNKFDGTVIDFKGTEMTKVVIEGDKVVEIRGFENVNEFEFVKGANPETIKFSN